MTTEVVAPPKKRRGLENAMDMVRTLAVVFALVIPLWFFGQASPNDSKKIRPIDPSGAYADFVRATHGPVPSTTPQGWTPNVKDYTTTPGVLRVGYVRGDGYEEFVGGRGTGFLKDATGHGQLDGTVSVNGVPWQLYRSGGHESLVLTGADGVTVLVGGVRETATRADLVALASLVR